MAWNPLLTELRELLADLYPKAPDALLVVVDAGLNPTYIALTDVAVQNWFNILSDADKNEKVLDVIAVAQRRFRTNKKLERLARTYREFMAETVGDQIVEEVGTRALPYDQLSSEQRAELVVDLLADVSGLIDQQTAQPLPFRDLVINPGLTEHILVQEQSYRFASVAAWLLSRAGGRYARVSAYLDQWTAEARSALEAQATAFTPKTAPAVVREPAEWSVLFFLGADTGRVFEGKYGKYSLMSNLSKFGRELLEQLQAAASNDRVAVLAQLDTLGDDLTSRWEMAPNQRLADCLVEEIPETNCGDPQTLADFVAWGAARRPAKKTALVLWGQGGWMLGDAYAPMRDSQTDTPSPDPASGCLLFDDSSMDYLTTRGLQRALSQVADGMGQPLDLLLCDLDLSAVADVCYQLRHLASYAVAIQDVAAMPGLTHGEIIARLCASPTVSARAFSELILDQYAISQAKKPGRGLTLSAIAMAKLQPGGYLVRAFCDAMLANLDADVRLASAVVDARKKCAGVHEDRERVDLVSFLTELLAAYGGDNHANVHSSIEMLLTWLKDPDDGPLAGNLATGKYAGKANGLAVYLPETSPSPHYGGLNFADLGWRDFVLKTIVTR